MDPRRVSRLALALLLATAPALAQSTGPRREPTAEDRATARALAAEGYQALKNGEYELAVDRFQRAEALVHAPTLLVDLARSLVGLGRLVEAHENYQLVIREGPSNTVPWSWQKAYENAVKEDAELEPRLAWITIEVYGHDNPTVKIDGKEISSAAIGVKRAIDPGRRTIYVEAPGLIPVEKTVDLPEGASAKIALTLLEEDAPPQPPKVEIVTANASSSESSYKLPMMIAFGVGAAGFVASGVTGALMLGQRSELKEQCDAERRCPSSVEGHLSKYRTYGTISAITLGVGVAGAATGLTLFLLDKKKDKERPPGRVALQPSILPGYVGVEGSF
jgi:hypothetical protein